MATGNGDNLYLVFGVESERDRGRESDWRRLIVFLLSVCRQWLWIYNTGGIFSWWMAGEYPAAFVSSLIKWQIVIQEMCIRPWSCRYFFYGNLLFLGCTCRHGGVNAELYPHGFLFFSVVLIDVFHLMRQRDASQINWWLSSLWPGSWSHGKSGDGHLFIYCLKTCGSYRRRGGVKVSETIS